VLACQSIDGAGRLSSLMYSTVVVRATQSSTVVFGVASIWTLFV
jgi:hypothetical protein